MSDKKVIGILGGMGPLATADLFQKITLHTAAACDQAHPRVCIDSNTNIADRTAALQTMPCDHLVLYLYIIPHTLPADNEIDATRPFGIEVRISYAGRRLRTEKREINQWSGASVEMRVDSKK